MQLSNRCKPDSCVYGIPDLELPLELDPAMLT
jgi:hypothetical protein